MTPREVARGFFHTIGILIWIFNIGFALIQGMDLFSVVVVAAGLFFIATSFPYAYRLAVWAAQEEEEKS